MAGGTDIDALVARGLDRYRAGDIDGALAIWESALAADPDDPRVLGYVDYVRQNYDELAGGSDSPMSEQLIPFGLARDDDDEYEISITAEPERMPEPAVDDGWGIDRDIEPTIERGRIAARAETIRENAPTMDFGPDFTRERTIERSPPTADLAPLIEPLPLPPPREFEERGTADLKIKRGAPAGEDSSSVEVEDLLLPPPPRPMNRTVDDDSRDERMPRPRALTADEELTERVSEDIDADAPLLENPDERARRRIVALLARARAAADAGDHATAVAAIDLALSEAPDLAAAQKLVHKSKDVILDCYYRFFGDLERRPVLAVPAAELTERPLDPRAAFLLSRIDGTLTYEEVLDVAGMGRLEACRHLAHLLWRGIIRVS